MPDVKGLSESTAVAKLKNMGLKPGVSTVPGSTGSQVVGQQPSAGSTVKAGQSVTIYVGG
jgi:beta-lactam-binding protein with PASTA domain